MTVPRLLGGKSRMIKSSKLASATLVSLRLAWAPWNPVLHKARGSRVAAHRKKALVCITRP